MESFDLVANQNDMSVVSVRTYKFHTLDLCIISHSLYTKYFLIVRMLCKQTTTKLNETKEKN